MIIDFCPGLGLLRQMRSRKRESIRVFKQLIKSDQLDFVNDVFSDIRNVKYPEKLKFCGVTFSGTSLEQYFSYRFCKHGLINQALISKSKSPVTSWLPIPQHWYDICRKHGICISDIKSGLAWKAFGCLSVCYATFLGLKVVMKKKPKSFDSIFLSKSIYLHGVSQPQLECPGQPEKFKNLVNWFLTQVSPEKIFISFPTPLDDSNKNNLLVNLQCPGELSSKKRISLLVFLVFLFLKGQLDALFSSGFMAVFSPEIIQKKIAMLMEKKCTLSHYYFPNSYYMYRPIWTDVMIERGAKVCLYFYSVNCMPFDIDGDTKRAHFGYQNMDWPICLVWNERFGDFIQSSSLTRTNCKVVKPIWFADNGADVPFVANSVTVFDVNSPRIGHYPVYGLNTHYYSDEVTIKFFDSLLVAAEKFGISLLIKRKRPDSQSEGVSKRIKQYLQRVDQTKKNVTFCDPGVSAERLIEKSLGVVAMPFTSPAQIGMALEIPSIFYDPTGRISRKAIAALGVPICSSQRELNVWFSELQSIRNN